MSRCWFCTNIVDEWQPHLREMMQAYLDNVVQKVYMGYSSSPDGTTTVYSFMVFPLMVNEYRVMSLAGFSCLSCTASPFWGAPNHGVRSVSLAIDKLALDISCIDGTEWLVDGADDFYDPDDDMDDPDGGDDDVDDDSIHSFTSDATTLPHSNDMFDGISDGTPDFDYCGLDDIEDQIVEEADQPEGDEAAEVSPTLEWYPDV